MFCGRVAQQEPCCAGWFPIQCIQSTQRHMWVAQPRSIHAVLNARMNAHVWRWHGLFCRSATFVSLRAHEYIHQQRGGGAGDEECSEAASEGTWGSWPTPFAAEERSKSTEEAVVLWHVTPCSQAEMHKNIYRNSPVKWKVCIKASKNRYLIYFNTCTVRFYYFVK